MTIRIERVKRGLTQSQLAEKLGISQVLLSKLERDVYTATKETAFKIRQVFKGIDEYGKHNMTNEKYETSDIALASYLHYSGARLLGITHQNSRRCIFIFESPQDELLAKWQEGKATVNALAFHNAYQALMEKIFRED